MKLQIFGAAFALLASCASSPEAPSGTVNLAYGKDARSNSHIYEFTADKAVDGEVLSYWEGAANAYPNDFTVDLGSPMAVSKVVVRLNPKRIWQPRTQTIEVLTSSDGAAFASAVAAKDYDFDPIDGDNSVTIPLSTTTRSVMLRFTGNSEATDS